MGYGENLIARYLGPSRVHLCSFAPPPSLHLLRHAHTLPTPPSVTMTTDTGATVLPLLTILNDPNIRNPTMNLTRPGGLAFHEDLLLVVDQDAECTKVFALPETSDAPDPRPSRILTYNKTVGVMTADFDADIDPDVQHVCRDHRGLVPVFDVAIDSDLQKLYTTNHNGAIAVHSLATFELEDHVSTNRHYRPTFFAAPRSITFDAKRKRLIFAEIKRNRLMVVSTQTNSVVCSPDWPSSASSPLPSGLAFDNERDRLILLDIMTSTVLVLAGEDYTLLFSFPICDTPTKQPTQKSQIYGGICVIPHDGRILVSLATKSHDYIQAYSHTGVFLGSLAFSAGCSWPYAGRVAFHERRGLIAFATTRGLHLIGPDSWLPSTVPTWRPERHSLAPKATRQAVKTFMMLRSLVFETPISLLPNELLFEIFGHL